MTFRSLEEIVTGAPDNSHGVHVAVSPTGERPPGPPEQASKWWVDGPYPAIVRGVDAYGEAFSDEADVEGISATDLLLRLRRRLVVDAQLFVVVHVGATPHTLPLCIALNGQIWRAESHGNGTYRIALKILRHRFL
jgi:hypothetical protein